MNGVGVPLSSRPQPQPIAAADHSCRTRLSFTRRPPHAAQLALTASLPSAVLSSTPASRPPPIAMDECKGEPPADALSAAAAAAAAAAERTEDSEMKDTDQPAAASASSAAAAVFLSRLLPARAEVAECDICNEPLDSSEAAAAGAAASRLPRLLPCGHSWCTGCIQKQLDASGGSAGMHVGTNCEQAEARC